MGKVLDKIKELCKHRLEEDWEEELISINIWEDVQDLYFKHPKDNRKANAILSLIVFAYDKESEWLDMHLDRMENKGRILKSLVGISFSTDEDYVNACVGIMSPYNQVTEWYLDYQCDRRWKDILSGYDYHSKATSMSAIAFNAKDMVDTGKMLREANFRREESDRLMDEIKKECVLIDTELGKEKRKKLSDRVDKAGFISHEVWIKGLESKDDKLKTADDEFTWD